MSYDEELQQTLREAAKRVNFASPIREGIYVGVSGPTYETQAEIEYLRGMHGDAVGMSTVPEVCQWVDGWMDGWMDIMYMDNQGGMYFANSLPPLIITNPPLLCSRR